MKACLVGAGFIAQYHLEAARSANAEVTAVCDTDSIAAHRFAARNSLRAYSSLEEMLTREAPGAVHILVPPRAHAAVARASLSRGIATLVEKPLAPSVRECDELIAIAAGTGARLAVSHNFLFADPFERLRSDLRARRIGRLCEVDVCWAKPLAGAVGATGESWPFDRPEHALLEVGVHALASALSLLDEVEDLRVLPSEPLKLENGREWFRRWEILGASSQASLRIRLSLGEGFPEHWIKLRGNRGSALLDLERGTYAHLEHTAAPLMLDRFAVALRSSFDTAQQASGHLATFLASRLRGSTAGGLFERSVSSAVRAFYDQPFRDDPDERISARLGRRTLALAERIVTASGVAGHEAPAPRASELFGAPAAAGPPKVLVLGGTGFIGRAVVRALRASGHSVRVLVRSPSRVPIDLRGLAVDLARGELEDGESLAAALDGIEHVIHLARGFGKRWDDILRSEIEPTIQFARACAGRVKTFQYASSVAIYFAGRGAPTINESTRPPASLLRANLYARTKWEIEQRLSELRRSTGLPLIIVRPGVVLGASSSPLHWGISAWPYPSVARLYGDGGAKLPIVLVEDVADAIVRALGVDAAIGESFNLVGPALLTASEYLDALERFSGLSFRRIPTSPARWFAEESLKYTVKLFARDPTRVRPSYRDWSGRVFAAQFDGGKARAVLDWRPESRLERILERGVAEPARVHFS